MHRTLNQVAALIRGIAPHDLEGRGVYVLDMGSQSERFHQHPSVLGLTHFSLDLALGLKPRGFCCMVNLAAVAARPGSFRHQVAGIVLHEAAHWMTFAEVYTLERDELLAHSFTPHDDLRNWAKTFDYRRGIEGNRLDYPSWVLARRGGAHCHRFCRAGLHLQHRARQLGWELSDADCQLCGLKYGTGSANDFRLALQTEFSTCRHKSIREILDRPTSTLFEKLAEHDRNQIEFLVLQGEHRCKSA